MNQVRATIAMVMVCPVPARAGARDAGQPAVVGVSSLKLPLPAGVLNEPARRPGTFLPASAKWGGA